MTDKLKQYPAFAIFVLIAVLFLGDRLIAHIAVKIALHSTMPHTGLYNGTGQGDIVILGNSRAYRHIDERMMAAFTGKIVRNYSMPAASGQFLAVLLEDYISRYGPPERVILEPSALSYDEEQLLAHRWFRHMSDNFDSELRTSDFHLWLFGHVFHLVNLNSFAFLNNLHKIVVPYEHKYRVDRLNSDTFLPESHSYLQPRSEGRAAFIRIVQLLTQYDVKLDVVLTPLHPDLLRKQTEFGPNHLQAWIQETAPTARIIAFDDAIQDSSAYADYTHLNEDGKNILMRKLAAHY